MLKGYLSLFILTTIITPCLSNASSGEHSYTIGVPSDGPFFERGMQIISEMYKHIGITPEFKQLPAERSLIDLNNGQLDAELFRIIDIQTKYDNIVAIPECVINFRHSAFTKSINAPIKNWNDLRPYFILYKQGHKMAEFNTQGMNTYPTHTNEQIFSMLNAGRGDIGISEYFTGVAIIEKLELENITPILPPLTITPMYHFVHKKHLDLIPQLTEAIKSVKLNQTNNTQLNCTLLTD